MNPSYAAALETRLRWLEWGKTQGARAWEASGYGSAPLPNFITSLEVGETFYMDPNFCGLVDHARLSVPDDLAFEREWLIRPGGWMYLDDPFVVPLPEKPGYGIRSGDTQIVDIKVRALGWVPLPAGTHVTHDNQGRPEILSAPATYFLCFLDFADYAT